MPVHASQLARHYARSNNPRPPRHLGTRYDLDGTFLAEPGNTIVCHLVEGSATQQALISARARYQGMSDAGKLAFTPVDSYHMTLFQGVIEGRRVQPFWPAEVAADTPIDAMTALFTKRLELFSSRTSFAVELVEALPTGLVVDGVTAADRHAMAEWRNAFADVFGYRHPDHDSYQFHITLAYMIDWIEDGDLSGWQTMLDEVAADIRARAPVLELRAPAFCSFADMNWFEELQVFGEAATIA